MKLARAVMIQGTTSDAGKSLLATALCRYLRQRNISVAPFKPQNMALNSAVTIDGGEIGRAQAVQAMACGIAPTTLMNPILLKPNSDTGSQVIVNGKAVGNMNAIQYHRYKPALRSHVITAFQQLLDQYQVIVVEGAGSPAEINLREHDIANMGFAEAVDCPVVLIADIDRGGVFAHIVGTLELLSESERRRVVGVVINRFRGDIQLLKPGIDWLQNKIDKPVFGVLPFIPNLYLEAEDSLANKLLQNASKFSSRMNRAETDNRKALNIAVVALPKISNHTDFDALQLHSNVSLRFVQHPNQLSHLFIDLLIIPGSKNTRQDMEWLLDNAWREYLQRHLRYGGKVIGICGGFQMLGRYIHDPSGVEGAPGTSEGLAVLDCETELKADKQLRNVKGCLSFMDANVVGYEIHVGSTWGPALTRPALIINHSDDGAIRNDGAISDDNQILGTYVHGLFDHAPAANALLAWCGLDETSISALELSEIREQSMDTLADLIATHLDMNGLMRYLDFASPTINCVMT